MNTIPSTSEIRGYGPSEGRPGLVSRLTRTASRGPYTVHYWIEKSSKSGNLFNVICFACDALWNGWMDGRPIINEGGRIRDKRCLLCSVGAIRFQRLTTATEDDVSEALERDLQLAIKGEKVAREGKSLSELLDKLLDSMGEQPLDTDTAQTPP